MITLPNNNKGFTLIELLIAMAISGVVTGAIYSAFQSQQTAYVTQEQVVDMQQNLRAAAYLMDSEIRMAGYDPAIPKAGAAIDIARGAELRFTSDKNGDGDFVNLAPPPANDENEQIRYALTNDADRDGIADASPCELGRETWGGGLQPAAENVDALGFAYAFDANDDGELESSGGDVIWAIDSDNDGFLDTNLDTNGDGVIDINDPPGGVGLANQVGISRIRAVRIWVLARTRTEARDYLDTRTYKVGDNLITPGDHFRRRLLTTNVTCRNLGL